jgi:hypothetical protein
LNKFNNVLIPTNYDLFITGVCGIKLAEHGIVFACIFAKLAEQVDE